MRPHIEMKEKVNPKQLKKITNNLNDASKSLVKIVGMGKTSGHFKRILNNVHVSHDCELPVVRGHHKDHKPGREMRILINGTVGPLINVSNITSNILEGFVEELRNTVEIDTCKSTEELLSHFVKYNETQDPTNRESEKFLSSIDIKSLYPSLKTDDCVETVRKVIISSSLKLEGFSYKDLSIFLRKSLSPRELVERNVNHLVPNQKKKSKSAEKYKDEYDKWVFPTENPDEKDIKKLFAEAIAYSCKLVMSNHVFMFDGEVYVQTNEGSTGLKLTGVLAELKMILWCIELSEKMVKTGVKNELLPRFVDDITMLPSVIKPGIR